MILMIFSILSSKLSSGLSKINRFEQLSLGSLINISVIKRLHS